MLNKTLKILLGIYIFLLLIILLTPSANIGFWLLIGTGLFTLITSIFIANDIKKLKNSLISRILSAILINSILYSAILVSYGLGNIGIGEKGLVFMFSSIATLVFLGLSLLIEIILIIKCKNQVIEYNPNKILSIILIIILIPLIYSSAISGIARAIGNPNLCSIHIELKDDSFMLKKGMQDRCIYEVAIDNLNLDYCKQIKDSYTDIPNSLKENCIQSIAFKKNDETICNQIKYDKDFCYSIIAENKKNPEICNYILDKEESYYCYTRIARSKGDITICEKYLSINDSALSSFSKETCIKEVQRILEIKRNDPYA